MPSTVGGPFVVCHTTVNYTAAGNWDETKLGVCKKKVDDSKNTYFVTNKHNKTSMFRDLTLGVRTCTCSGFPQLGVVPGRAGHSCTRPSEVAINFTPVSACYNSPGSSLTLTTPGLLHLPCHSAHPVPKVRKTQCLLPGGTQHST